MVGGADRCIDFFRGDAVAHSQGATTMTWDAEREDDSWDDDDSGEELSAEMPRDRPPTVWPVFVTFVGALVAIFGLQIILAVGLVIWLLVQGADLQEFARDPMDALAWPGIIVTFATVSQLVIAAAAVIGAWYTSGSLVRTLGFGKPALRFWELPIVIVGAMAPAAFGAALAAGLAELVPPDPLLEKTIGRITMAWAAPFILFISLTPGFAEEAFFRGYMQGRLCRRWPAWVGILISSGLFALLHLNLHQIVFAFPLGCWLGVIAWRTGSIWPCIVVHAAWNAGSATWSIGERLWDFPEYPPLIPSIIVGVVVLVCFIASIWLLARTTRPDADDDIPMAEVAPL
jgi:uncharacterized protein